MCIRVVGSDLKPWGSLTLWLGVCVCVCLCVVLVADRMRVVSQGPWEASRDQDLPHLAGPPVCPAVCSPPACLWGKVRGSLCF